MTDNKNLKVQMNVKVGTSTLILQKWGGVASFLLVIAFIIAPLIYLVGNLQDAIGPFAYALADFLYGPVWAASLVTAIFALRERVGKQAPLRMSFALLAAVLAAATMVLVACIRSSNRHYHIIHPELHLEASSTVLVVWATLVQGVTAAGWHFLGWALVLVGLAGWTTRSLPRGLNILYLAGGIASLFVYVFPTLEPAAAALGVIWAVWQGILLWTARAGDMPVPDETERQPG
jgi:hypothetical protein